MRKLYYGKYTNSYKSYSVPNELDSIDLLDHFKKNHIRILADMKFEPKFVIRPSKDKQFLSLFTYFVTQS
jgi:hypothetical protein